MSKKSWLKILIVWVLYVLLHFTYKYFPNPVFVLFGCPEETIFQHMKMGFFSYSLVSIIEYFILKTKLSVKNFVITRMFSALLISFFCFIIWYIWPLFFGPIPTEVGEIIYSNIIIILSLITVVSFEVDIEKSTFSKITTIGIAAAWIIALCFYVILSSGEAPVLVFELHAH